MRGKQNWSRYRRVTSRITPAHAGKTEKAAARGGEPRDHPRACGENMLRLSAQSSAKGSPPRMRGKRSMFAGSIFRARITPAHAGKTCAAVKYFAGLQDHPRACGENAQNFGALSYELGSPPRMRGKLTVSTCPLAYAGITPAHAGKTRPKSRFWVC